MGASAGPLVVEGALAAAAGPPPPAALVVPRERAGLRRVGPPVWRALDPERALAVLLAAPADALVMARPPAADPGSACLPALARLIDIDVIALPAAAGDAAWAVALAWRWRAEGQPGLTRLLEVLAGIGAASAVPRRPWGAAATPVPALRPAALARWAARCWRPCGWCRSGGGLPGRPCGRCGAPMPPAAPAVPPARRREPILAGAGER
jgi:hypothetical protein